MKTKILFLISLLTTILSACSASVSADDPLDGTSWELVALGKQPALEGTTITISFEDGLARGSSGCNSYGGAYQVEGEKIKFQEFESSLMDCLNPTSVMEQETDYLQSLAKAQSFEISDSRLLIYWSENSVLTFRPNKQDN